MILEQNLEREEKANKIPGQLCLQIDWYLRNNCKQKPVHTFHYN